VNRLKRLLWPTLLTLTATSIALAQGETSCPVIVQTALDSTRLMCSDTGRNQACYGNVMLEAQPQSGAENFTFDSVGDLVDTNLIASLRLSSLDEAASQWGVALMEIQASIPDSMPQNVTLLLFGNVQINNVASQLPDVEMQPLTNVNIRRNPSINGAVIASADAAVPVVANGRLSDNSWVRIQLPEDAIGYGWIYADGLDGNLESLAIVEPDEPHFGPMQAFTFETGVEDAPCAEAPSSGLLIQTPEGVGEIRIWLNQVSVRLGSTVYFQAQRGGNMTVSVLEGHAVIRAQNQTRYVPAGAQVEVPMSDTLSPAGAPREPHAYNPAEFAAFNATVATLPRQVAVSEPVSDQQLAYFVSLNDIDNDNNNNGGAGGAGGVVSSAPATVDSGVNAAIDVVNTATNTTDETVHSVTNAADATVNAVGDTVNQTVNDVLGEGGVVDDITDALPGGDVIDGAVNQVADTTGEVVDTVTDTVDDVTDTTDEVVDTVTDTVDNTVDTVTDVVGNSPLGGLLGH